VRLRLRGAFNLALSLVLCLGHLVLGGRMDRRNEMKIDIDKLTEAKIQPIFVAAYVL
jgi:hypothetical protein